MAAKEKNELSVEAGSFNLVTMYDGMDEEARGEFMDEMDDLEGGGIDYRAIKMPSGKVRSFTVEGDDPDDPDQMKEVRGVMVFTHLVNAWWANEYGSGDSNAPSCSSMDGKTSLDGRSCEDCPRNRFKDDGSAKECKNMRRIYLMMEGQPSLYMMVVPPTSLRDVRTQLRRLMAGGQGYTSAILSFTLTGATSRGGNDYSKIVIKKVGQLSPEQANAVKAMRQKIKESYRSVQIAGDDIVDERAKGGGWFTPTSMAAGAAAEKAAPPVTMGGFMEIPEDAESELPFM